jgi:NADH-quinone oxidoreductase subunit H
MFQLGEFASLVLISILASLLFLGGWIWPFNNDLAVWAQALLMLGKTTLFIIFFMWMRGSMPRLRIDQLMVLCWQILIPFTLLQVAVNGLVLVYDWPDWTLAILSGIAAIALVAVVYQAARRSGATSQPRVAQQVGGVL